MTSINSPAERSAGVVFLTLLLAAVVFFSNLGRRDIVTSHEARVVQTARQMAASGWPWQHPRISVPELTLVSVNGRNTLRDDAGGKRITVNPWIIPVLNGVIRLKKPPLPYWIDAILFRIVGFSETAARFPTALLGFAGAILIFDLARLIYGRRAAWPAMIVWITTHFVVDEFRKTMADPYLAFATLAAVWAWVRMTRSLHPIKFIMAFYLSLAVGALAKGPVVLVMVLPALIIWQITRRTRRTPPFRTLGWHLVGIAMFVVIVSPWLILVLRSLPGAWQLWKYELEADEKPREAYYYLLTIGQLALLWTIPWIIGIALTFIHGRRGWLAPRGRRRLFAVGWLIVVLLIFSLKAEKKNAYLLPVMPAVVLLASDVLGMMLIIARRKKTEGLSGILMVAQAIIGIGFAASLIVLVERQRMGASVIGVCCAVLVIALLPIWAILRKQPRRWLGVQAVTYVAVLMVFIGVYMPQVEQARSPRPFAARALEISQEMNISFWRAKLPEELSVYLPIDLPDRGNSQEVLIVVDDPKNAFFGTVREFEAITDGLPVLDARSIRVAKNLSGGRYKLFVVTLRAKSQVATAACCTRTRAACARPCLPVGSS